MKNETKLIHKGRRSTKHHGAVNPPIVSSSTLVFPTLADYENAERGEAFYENIFGGSSTDPAYGIAGNQTTFALQEVIRELENGHACFITPSGLAAITLTLQALLKAGDHVLITDTVYGPTRRFCNKVLKNQGIEVTYFDPELAAGIEKLIQPNTKLIFLESPGSLTFEIHDIEPIVAAAKKHKIFTAIDNSWASPLYFTPLKWGVDISIHAITKYINGHSDLLMGSITCNEKTSSLIADAYKNFGTHASAYDCYQALRGIRTLRARLELQARTLEKVIQYLSQVDEVKEILCPSYAEFKGHNLWRKYFSGTTPLFSIVLDKKYSQGELAKMVDGYDFFSIGASWGGFESLVRPIDIDITRSVNRGKYKTSVVRYYIGLEDSEDIISDLQKGFERLGS